jgi:hypothetical protein
MDALAMAPGPVLVAEFASQRMLELLDP